MSNYRYSLSTLVRSSSESYDKNKTSRVVRLVDDDTDVLSAILTDLLEELRQTRFDDLMKNYKDNSDDVEALRAYLPSEYKKYANDLDLLKESMASLYEVSGMYEISDIQLAPQCYGCLYYRMGQDDHMECGSGCLHDPTTCPICS